MKGYSHKSSQMYIAAARQKEQKHTSCYGQQVRLSFSCAGDKLRSAKHLEEKSWIEQKSRCKIMAYTLKYGIETSFNHVPVAHLAW